MAARDRYTVDWDSRGCRIRRLGAESADRTELLHLLVASDNRWERKDHTVQIKARVDTRARKAAHGEAAIRVA